jgi:hypothetical protein
VEVKATLYTAILVLASVGILALIGNALLREIGHTAPAVYSNPSPGGVLKLSGLLLALVAELALVWVVTSNRVSDRVYGALLQRLERKVGK